MGTFKERIQWVGDPRWKDGSIVIHNLDYSDNGTFTCDVKNPPDIVGKTSKVTLYVFEKGARGHGTGEQGAGVWEVGQGGVRKDCAAGGGGQMPALLPFGFWEGGRKAASGGRRCGTAPARPSLVPLPSQCPLATGWCWAPSSGAFWAGCCCCCCCSTWSGTAGSAGRRPCRGGSGKGREGPLQGWEAPGEGRLRPPCRGLRRGHTHSPAFPAVPWRRGDSTSLARTRPSAAGRLAGLRAWTAGEESPGSRRAERGVGRVTDVRAPPQTPVLYAMLDHSRSTKAASEKKSKGLGESRKDKK